MPVRQRFRRTRASAPAAAAVVVGLALVAHPVLGQQEREARTVREDQAVAEQQLVRLSQFFDVPAHAVDGDLLGGGDRQSVCPLRQDPCSTWKAGINMCRVA